MKNKKLINKLLLGSAIGAMSLITSNTFAAVTQIQADGQADTSNAANVQDGFSFDSLKVNNTDGWTLSITGNGAETISFITAKVAKGTIEITDNNNNGAANYKLDKLTTNKVDGTEYTITQSKLGSTLTIKDVALNDKSDLIVSGAGAQKAQVILADTDKVTHTARSFIADGGNGGALLVIRGESEAKLDSNNKGGYVAINKGVLEIRNNAKGPIRVGNDSKVEIGFDNQSKNTEINFEGDAIIAGAAANPGTLLFGVDKANHKGTINYKGKIDGAGAGQGILSVDATNGSLDVTIDGQVGQTQELAQIKVQGGQNGTAKLTLQENSKATTYNYDKYSTLILEANGGEKTHTGAFDGGGTLTACGEGKVKIVGTVDNGELHVGTETEVTNAIGGNNLVAIKFLEKTTLTASNGITGGSKVDFDKKEGNLVISGANSTLGEITNVAGSTITMNSGHTLTLGTVGQAGELLNLNAGDKATDATTFVVSDKSFFDTINTGKGALQFADDDKTIFAKKIEGAKIDVNKAQTIQLLEKDGIKSKEINFSDAKTLTIVGHEREFGDFISNVTFTNQNANRKLVLEGSGTIKSNTTEAIDGGISIAQDRGDIVAINVADNHSHKAKLDVGKGTLRLDSDYENSKSITIGGTLDLRAKANGDEKREGRKLNLTSTTQGEGLIMNPNSTLHVTDGSEIKVIKAQDLANAGERFNVKLDSRAYGDEENKIKFMVTGAANGDPIDNLTAKSMNLIQEGDNLFTKDSLYADDKLVDDQTGQFKSAHILRQVDKKKIEDFAKEKNLSGNLKVVTDEIIKSMKDEGSLRKFMIDVGSNKDRAVNNLASILPRNLTETQARTFRTQEVLGVSRAAVTCGAADDLQSTSALWIKGNFGKASQSQSEMSYVAYDLTTMGATIGAEFALGESVTVGAAGTYAKTKLEYKDLRDGEKDELSSFLGSVYGNATFANNFVLNGTFVVGNTSIEGHSTDLSGKSTKADQKLSAMSYGGTMLAGYKFAKETFSVTPLGGMSIANFVDPERKVANGYGTVKGSDLTRIDLVGGLTVAGEMRMSDMVLEPELHGFVYYNLKDEKNQQSIKFDSQELTPILTNTTKTNFVLGGGLSSKTGMVEYGLTVDGQFADKYWGVLGSLKLKVNL